MVEVEKKNSETPMNPMLKGDLDGIKQEFHRIIQTTPPKERLNPEFILGYIIEEQVKFNYDAEKALKFLRDNAEPRFFGKRGIKHLWELVEDILCWYVLEDEELMNELDNLVGERSHWRKENYDPGS
jgi:hypothetical protein